jgi:hypothetical protein
MSGALQALQPTLSLFRDRRSQSSSYDLEHDLAAEQTLMTNQVVYLRLTLPTTLTVIILCHDSQAYGV